MRYVNGVITVPLFKRYLKLIEKVKQFTKAFEEMDELKMDESEKEEDFFSLERMYMSIL